jgi:hypothetical protein
MACCAAQFSKDFTLTDATLETIRGSRMGSFAHSAP